MLIVIKKLWWFWFSCIVVFYRLWLKIGYKVFLFLFEKNWNIMSSVKLNK